MKVDRDLITTEATLVGDFEGGQLYRVGTLDIAVLNGTYKEMGRQYGSLVKDKILSTRDSWKKVFIDSGTLSYESILEVIGIPFYTSSPKKLKDLYQGISETSGISLHEAVVLDNWLSLVVTGRRAGCSCYMGWGDKTIDGSLYMGRNLDFPEFARDLFAANGVVAVLNPIGGEFSVAGIGTAGTIASFDDAMNSEGLSVNVLNGVGSIQPVLYSNRLSLISFLGDSLASYSTIEELKILFNTTNPGYPGLISVGQPDKGVHFEVSPETYFAKESPDQFSVRANQFTYPDWGIPQLPGATGWFSMTRQEAWLKAIDAAKTTKIDEHVLMEVMTAPMWNSDGTLTGTGFTVFEHGQIGSAGGDEGADVTMIQVISQPAERKWWIRVPTHTGWMEIDLKKYFKRT